LDVSGVPLAAGVGEERLRPFDFEQAEHGCGVDER
jgi:hypothetical protein